MNWIRDNILKLIVFLFIAIVVIVVIVACSKKGGTVTPGVESASGYNELEEKMQQAAINYTNRNTSLLPKTENKPVKVKLDTLVKNRYIKEVHAIEDSSVTCSGYVEIEKTINKTYKYVPYLKCGNHYQTKTLSQYIIDNEPLQTTDEGLYKDGNGYVFKGEFPRNHIVIDDVNYRILSITEEGYIKLIREKRTKKRYLWDNRYNKEINKYYGINTDFGKTRMEDNLYFLFKNEDEEQGEVFLTRRLKNRIVKYDYCIGKRKSTDNDIKSESECKETFSSYIGLINVSDYYKASTSSDCNYTNNLSCNNYNYLFGFDYDVFVTFNASDDNTYSYNVIDGGTIEQSRCNYGYYLYPVVYLNSNVTRSSGTGTPTDPYYVR